MLELVGFLGLRFRNIFFGPRNFNEPPGLDFRLRVHCVHDGCLLDPPGILVSLSKCFQSLRRLRGDKSESLFDDGVPLLLTESVEALRGFFK